MTQGGGSQAPPVPPSGLGCGLAAHRGLFGVGRGERGLIRRPLSHIGDQHDL